MSLFRKAAKFPELSGVDPGEAARTLEACRWKPLRHWQVWVTACLVGLACLASVAVAALWYFNLRMGFFPRLPLSLLALLASLFVLTLICIQRKVFSYCLASHLVKALCGPEMEAVLPEHGRLQQLRKRSIRRGILLSVTLLVSATATGVFLAKSPWGDPSPQPLPEALQTAGIVQDLPGVTRRPLFEDPRLAHVTDIAFRESPGKEVMIVSGTQGALFVGADRSRFVPFSQRQDHVDYIPLDNQGTSGFMNRGAWCSDALVTDESGRTLWSCSASQNGIDDMASGDIDGDGAPEFAVGFNGGGGLRLLDSRGVTRWEEPDGNVWHVEFADLKGDGRKQLVHSNARGEITVRGSRGEVLSRTKPSVYFSEFSLVRWPAPESPERLLHAEDDTIRILDGEGTTMAQFCAPAAGSLGEARGTLVALRDGTRVLATVVDFCNWDRSVLYLHDLSDKLLYQEVLPESCRSLAVRPGEGTRAERLLVGCAGKVIEYRIE